MQTEIIKINPQNPKKQKVAAAAAIIRKGGIVAFPTETVYGLGADATNEKAVRKIYAAKGRPPDNPMIVHIANTEDLYNLSTEVPPGALRLAKKFWPGPLTLVLKKSRIIPAAVTAGLDTAALRMPANKIALELVKQSGPIAAPSANLSGRPSPTNARHVIEDLYGRVDVIIDGGPSDVGIESTVIDMTTDPPVLLRPGKVTLEQLRRTIGKVSVHTAVRNVNSADIAKSPGMKYRHYSPRARVILVSSRNTEKRISQLRNEMKGKKVKVISIKNKERLASSLFNQFREADRKGFDIIIVRGVSEKGLGLAIMNRLRKAATTAIEEQ